ncbi:MAG: hypothetical protein EBZ59_10710 [Planctomycetia bacterium]|nr:hypothetical protein [Planctomycetia bacterium]
MRVPEAAVPFRAVGPKGRIVLAGDHLQLPPIVQGAYPEPPPGERLLHRSIFEAAQGAVGSGSPVVQKLLENRRMNDVLTRVSSELVYGPDYTCFDDRVAGRRLRYTGCAADSDLAGACLDPAHPLVVVTLDGVRAGGENPTEARLVADLVVALRRGLPYADDATFFAHGVFVVSPHRAQNRAIRRELASRRSWTAAPFVDTVDKMQGQEAEAVVVSYGVADPEYAVMEAEFIYSLNRLNVAMTRAQTKCVVFLPQPLLDAPPQVLEMPEAAKGLGFMQNMIRRLDALGDTLTFSLSDGVTARVRRVAR